MNDRIASAVFDSRDEAQSALTELRAAGFSDNAISIIGARDDAGRGTGSIDGSTVLGNDSTNRDGTSDAGTHSDQGATDDAKGDGVKGAAIGAGAGVVLGIAALAIPGVGPLVAAGAIAASAVPTAAAIGGGVGLAAGGIAGMLAHHGVDAEGSAYYESRISDGGTFVSVQSGDTGGSIDEARAILLRNGGQDASRERSDMTA